MIKKSLIHTNPYLKNPSKRRRLFKSAVAGSSAVEGVVIRPSRPSAKKRIKRK